MFSRLLVLFPVCASLALAQFPAPAEPSDPAAPEEKKEVPKPSVKKLDENRYQVGQVTFDKKTREIRFPAKVNMTEGLLEFLVVHQKGKLHESLFATETSPTDINLAFYPDALYVIVGVKDAEPDVRAWRIVDGNVSPGDLKVVD